jgi:type I restriction enzyme S subunit
MTSDWPEIPIGEVCEGIYDGPHATPPKTDSGPVFLGIWNLVNGQVDLSETEHVSDEFFKKWTRRVTPRAGDIVFSYETRLGDAAMIPEGLICCLGRRMALARPDQDKIDPRFLLYSFLAPEFQETIRKHTVHGSTVDRIPLLEFPNFPIRLPPRSEQEAIAAVLGALDDKIEQNRRTGRALEGLARATFKAWFVDFEPVKAKAAGQTSFPGLPPAAFAALPDRLTDSALGPVPEGWDEPMSVSELERKGLLLIGDGYRAKRTELAGVGVPFIRAGNVNGTIQTRGAELLGSTAVAKAGVKRSQTWDTVFTSKGTVGRIGLVTPTVGEVVYAPQVCFWRSANADSLSPFVLHLWMKSDRFTNQWMSVKGQTDMADFVSLSDQRAMTMLVPPREMQRAFDTVARPLIELQATLEAESSKLAALRDYLLPRLLSGRVRVREAEARVEDIA